jgi:hypothetical protein
MNFSLSPVTAVRWSILAVGLLLISACAHLPEAEPLSPNPELDSFAREIGRNLEAHQWQSILVGADPDHFRIQVAEGGMGEPQYVAELFGLHRVDNNIRRGDTVAWEDLERIESVDLQQIEQIGDRYRLTGSARLRDGTTLDLQAQILERNGRFRLTGGVG